MEQRTEEWFAARAGKVTASMVYDVFAKTGKGEYYKARDDYLKQLLCERLTGLPTETPNTPAMRRGTELEPKARAVYIIETGNDVDGTGFVQHPSIEGSGASPDGLVYPDGLIEIKCPNTATHIDFLQSGEPKPEYYAQMQWQMACTGRQWCDFVSYDDRLPEDMACRVKRFKRNEEFIAMMETEVALFLTELAEEQEKLERLASLGFDNSEEG